MMDIAISEAIKNTENKENTIEAEFCFSKNCPIFKGHFPQNPVVPAVYQLKLCRSIIEKNLSLYFVSLKKSRFLKICVPECSYLVKISLCQLKDKKEATCCIYNKATKELCSKLVMEFIN
jgi:3-hydroxymyristoyl/3-hydroxydecanoyl-(acyl carrier protein) dehydratase